jgi:hypothetical protein
MPRKQPSKEHMITKIVSATGKPQTKLRKLKLNTIKKHYKNAGYVLPRAKKTTGKKKKNLKKRSTKGQGAAKRKKRPARKGKRGKKQSTRGKKLGGYSFLSPFQGDDDDDNDNDDFTDDY